MPKQKPITICNETIHPGERISLALPLPELFSCAPMYMPLNIFHSKKEGPCVLILGAMHGNELNGTEIIHRLMQSSAISKMAGTIISIPIMNVYGFINKTRTLPGGAQLDKVFPGAATGSHAARFANIFCEEVFSLADFCIDLQTGWLNHSNLPQVFVSPENTTELEMAKAFGAPVITEFLPTRGSLRAFANKQKVPYLVYEAGEAMRFDEHAIKVGMKGVLRVLRHLGMLKSQKKQTDTKSFITQDIFVVRSPTSGISHSTISLGQQVKKGERLAVIKDPFSASNDVNVLASDDGVIVSMNNLPLVHEGVSLFEIASFERLSQAVSHFEDIVEEMDE